MTYVLELKLKDLNQGAMIQHQVLNMVRDDESLIEKDILDFEKSTLSYEFDVEPNLNLNMIACLNDDENALDYNIIEK